MLTDKATIRNAIMKRIPEIYLLHFLDGVKAIHIFALAKITDYHGDTFFVGIEEDNLPYHGSHKDCMNVVDRVYDEVQKYKRRQLELKTAIEKLGPVNNQVVAKVVDAEQQPKKIIIP